MNNTRVKHIQIVTLHLWVHNIPPIKIDAAVDMWRMCGSRKNSYVYCVCGYFVERRPNRRVELCLTKFIKMLKYIMFTGRSKWNIVGQILLPNAIHKNNSLAVVY